jgi:small ligand-binding sensory domain FIST
MGDKWESYNPGNYINRMCVGVDPESKALFMAEMDIAEGTEVQLMRRSFEMEYVAKRTKKLIDKVKAENRRIIFGMYINCSGRAAAYSNHTDEDVRHVQEAINGEFPLLGIYEAGELAVIKNELQVLDWTGLFCLFSEEIV